MGWHRCVVIVGVLVALLSCAQKTEQQSATTPAADTSVEERQVNITFYLDVFDKSKKAPVTSLP